MSERKFPIKYLGLLLHIDKLRKEDLPPLLQNKLVVVGLAVEAARH